MPLKVGRRINPKTIGLQAGAMRQWFPQFSYRRNGNCLIWIGSLKPRQESPEYKIRIEYSFRHHPRVYVLSPEILQDAPHTYLDENTLCLYYPYDGDWSSEKLIAYTIMPWTVEWLRYYEIWYTTGKWFGPEAPHSGTK